MQQPPNKTAPSPSVGLSLAPPPNPANTRAPQISGPIANTNTSQNANANTNANTNTNISANMSVTTSQAPLSQTITSAPSTLSRPVGSSTAHAAPTTHSQPNQGQMQGQPQPQSRPLANQTTAPANQNLPRNMPAPQMRIQPQASYPPGPSSTQSYSAMSPISELPPFPNPPNQTRASGLTESTQPYQSGNTSTQQPLQSPAIHAPMQGTHRAAPPSSISPSSMSMQPQYQSYQGQQIKTQSSSVPTPYRERTNVRPLPENEPPAKVLRVDDRSESTRSESVSFVNTQADEKKLLADNRDAPPPLHKLQREPLYINVDLVKQMIEKKVHGAGLTFVKDDVLDMISKMAAFRMRNIMEELVSASAKRTEKEKQQYSTYVTEDVKPYLAQLEKEGKELDLKEKESNANQVKDKAREKELRREQLREKEEEDKFNDTNNTAIAAIEGRLRLKPSAQPDASKSLPTALPGQNKGKAAKDGAALPNAGLTGLSGVDSSSSDQTQKMQKWVRPTPIPFNCVDIVYTMGRDPRMRKSALYYKMLYKTFTQ